MAILLRTPSGHADEPGIIAGNGANLRRQRPVATASGNVMRPSRQSIVSRRTIN